MDTLRTVVLMLATVSMGLMAGTFALYAHTIMPGLGKLDARTFVVSFQTLDRAIINPWFLGSGFLGAIIFTLLATLAHLGRSALPWIACALGLYAVAFLITIAVHLPLNDTIKAVDPNRVADLATIRAAFHESRWVSWNIARVVATTVALGLLAWALVVHGKSI